MKSKHMLMHVGVCVGVVLLVAMFASGGSSWIRYLPFLACPLMMVFMMRGMNHGPTETHTNREGVAPEPTRVGSSESE